MYIGRGKQFDRQYKKLPTKTQKQFGTGFNVYLKNQHEPLLHVHTLSGKYRGQQSFNVSADIRVVFLRDQNRLFLVAIGSHSQLYG